LELINRNADMTHDSTARDANAWAEPAPARRPWCLPVVPVIAALAIGGWALVGGVVWGAIWLVGVI
jgi:hypothetical protein